MNDIILSTKSTGYRGYREQGNLYQIFIDNDPKWAAESPLQTIMQSIRLLNHESIHIILEKIGISNTWQIGLDYILKQFRKLIHLDEELFMFKNNKEKNAFDVVF